MLMLDTAELLLIDMISREDQDQYAPKSAKNRKAQEAMKYQDEIVPQRIEHGGV